MSNFYRKGYAQELVIWHADYPQYAIEDAPGLASQSFNTLISEIFSRQSLQEMDNGLFAWGFMDDSYIHNPGTARNKILEIILRHTSPDSE